MKIKKLIKDFPDIKLKGSKEVEITGVCSNSKIVAPGNLFIARKGNLDHGLNYIEEAVLAGAVAIATDIYDPSLKDVTQLIHPNVAQLEGPLAAQYYQNPSHELFTVGITGTNGKTTTSFLVKHLLDSLDVPCGLIGTIEYIVGNFRYQATRTTPDVCNMHRLLREMILQGCQAGVMEVTSHALDQDRVSGIDFDVAIFTNLTQDHLDYHQNMENYGMAKRKLFTQLNPLKEKKCHTFSKTAIVNVDDSWCNRITQGCQANILTYGIRNHADLQASELTQVASGSSFKLSYQGQNVECKSPFIGLHNVYNYMAAAAVGLVRKVPLMAVTKILDKALMVPGRLERVDNPLGLQIFVDFAHTSDALKNILECLQTVKNGRILTIFGCGGDRDKTKRPKMAAVCEALSDFSIVTSDNPRKEDPQEICQEIARGFTKSESFIVEVDRRKAIEKGIELAKEGDILLIAGKGHEPYQIFSHQTLPFDDRQVAREICFELAGKNLR